MILKQTENRKENIMEHIVQFAIGIDDKTITQTAEKERSKRK